MNLNMLREERKIPKNAKIKFCHEQIFTIYIHAHLLFRLFILQDRRQSDYYTQVFSFLP